MAFLIGGVSLPANNLVSNSVPATDNAVARYDGVSGLALEDSLVTISDLGATVIPAGGSLTVAALSGVLKAAAGLVSGGADSDDVPEGAVNFYYTEARFDSSFSGKSTTDLSEGTNLYYTEVRVSANTDVTANTAARHTHANQTELDLITDGDHDIRTDNPHSTSFTQAVAADAGTDISAAEAETLTDGSNADALHSHTLSVEVPGGADTQVQFNDSGAFGGDAGLTYNKTTDKLTVAGDLEVSTTGKQILASDAGNATPAYSFAADPNTGLVNSAANQLTLAIDGGSAIDISGTRDTHRVLLRFSPDASLDIGGPGAQTRPRDLNLSRRILIDSKTQIETSGADTLISTAAGAGQILTLGTTSGYEGASSFKFGAGIDLGFFGTTPVAQSAAYTVTNVSTDRSYDANSTTLDEQADVLGTLIADLKLLGIIG